MKLPDINYPKKDVTNSYGEVPINIPQNRKSKFEPRAIRKYETDCSKFDIKK